MRELAAALPRTISALPSWIGSRPLRLSLNPRMRRRLVLAALVALVLAGLYHFWLRDSSLVAVKDVQVTGLTTKDGPRIQAMLESVAEDMTTLHVQKNELEEAVSTFPVVGSLHVQPDFPHGLLIEVTERPAAALVEVDGVPTPVAADGTILRGLRVPEGLPQVRMEKPASESHVTDPSTLRALLVAGAAPEGFPQRIERVSEDSEHGIVLALEDGPDLFFGDADLVDEKWTAAVRVMADADAAGASYIDVRLPERPVAGGLPVETIEPVAPAGDVIAPPAEPSAPDVTAAPEDGTVTPETTPDPTATTEPTTTTPAPTTTVPTDTQP